MRSLITGISGFLGSHLAELLVTEGQTVLGTFHRTASNLSCFGDKVTLLPCDIVDRERVDAVIKEARPDVIFHLAAQSLPGPSWQEPETTLQVNIFGTLYLLEAIRKAGIDPTIVVACSSAEYSSNTIEKTPLKESEELHPNSPYAVSKVTVDLLSRLYWQVHGLRVIRVRPFLVIGPRKTRDVCSDFARGIVAVEQGNQQVLKVGNLEAVRDFLDVQDAVRAFWLLAQKAQPGEVYNLCSGVGHQVGEVLEVLLTMAKRPARVEKDASRMRPADDPVLIGDNSRLRALGWEPRTPFRQTLENILDYWRQERSADF